jgi:undecaprenyl diphosphate synthase
MKENGNHHFGIRLFQRILHGRQPEGADQTWREFEAMKPTLEGKTILVILDGNRRFASARGLEKTIGHRIGAEKAKEIARFLLSLKMNVVFWGFSTDNWKRDADEVNNIFQLAESTLAESVDEMHEHGVRIKHLGSKEGLHQGLIETIQRAEKTTAQNTGPLFEFALNYSGQDENNRTAVKVLQDIEDGKIIFTSGKNLVDAHTPLEHGKTFSEYTRGISDDQGEAYDVDITVRPGGEKRLSGFGSRTDNSELYFLDKKFPELTTLDLAKVLIDFSKRERRFGGNSKG